MDFLHPAFAPVIIFVLRVVNNAVGTLRVIAMNDQLRAWGFVLASLESLLFAYTAGLVLTNLENVPNLAAYVLGFAVGGYVGMAIERRYLHIYDAVMIVAPLESAHTIAEQLRTAGYAVTEIIGRGARGEVESLRCVVHHRDVATVIQIAHRIKPDAFITVEQSRYMESSWLKAQRHHHR